MTSPFAQLFVAIQNRLMAITATVNGVEQRAFPWIDQDLMQLESHNGDNRPPVDFPAITIDIDDSNFKSLGDNVQEGIIKVCIRIGFAPWSSSSAITPAQWRNKAIGYYDLEQAVHLAMQGWTPGIVTIDDTTNPATTVDLSDVYGKFVRMSATTEKRNDRIRVRVLTYTVGIDDYSTQEQITLTPASVVLSDQITI